MCLPCRQDWKPFSNGCYKYFTGNSEKSWNDAKTDCEQQNATLVDLKDSNKFSDIKEYITAAKRRSLALNYAKIWVS